MKPVSSLEVLPATVSEPLSTNSHADAGAGETAITLVIVEHDPMIRESLRELVMGLPKLHCLAVLASVTEALLKLPGLQPDVMLFDARLLVHDGAGLIAKFKACSPATRILILTTFDLGGLSFRSVCDGASGDLPKTTPAAELVQAVRWIHAGGSLMSMPMARRVIAHLEARPASVGRGCRLDRKEREIVGALARGTPYPVIAGEHGVGVPAVLAVLRGVYEKFATAGVSHETRTGGFS